MNKKLAIRLIVGLLLLALLLAFCYRAGFVLMPVYTAYGSGWNMYRQEPENSLDVLFFGSSLCYCDVVPAAIWEESGLSSFVMAGPEQTPSMSYYYIREALKTQSPKAICLELTGFCFKRYTNYTKVNVGYMPWSAERLGATFFAAEPAEREGLLFPLYNYHERWEGFSTLLQPRADEKRDPLAGYTLMADTTPQTERKEREYTLSEETFEDNLRWLARIRDDCARRGVRLILFQVPSCAWVPEEKLRRIEETAGSSVELWDFNAEFDALGLDLETDFFDFLHTNVYGAVKFSDCLARRLAESGVTADAHDEALWQWRADTLHQRMDELSGGK